MKRLYKSRALTPFPKDATRFHVLIRTVCLLRNEVLIQNQCHFGGFDIDLKADN